MKRNCGLQAGSCTWRSARSAMPVAALTALALLLALPHAAQALSNAYCSSYPWATFNPGLQCPPCTSLGDKCNPVDTYWSNGNICVNASSTPGLATCGPAQTYELVNPNTTTAGTVTIFQSSDMWLYVTYKMTCPFVLRGKASSSEYITGLYVWSAPFPTMPQYKDVYPLDGSYTCITFSVDLRHVCNPQTSQFSFGPLAQANHGCTCMSNSGSCPPSDLTSTTLYIMPSIYAVSVDSACRDDGTYLQYTIPTNDGTGIITWTPQTSCTSSPTQFPPITFPPLLPPGSSNPEDGQYPPSAAMPPAATPPIIFQPTSEGNLAPPLRQPTAAQPPPIRTASPPPALSPPAAHSPPAASPPAAAPVNALPPPQAQAPLQQSPANQLQPPAVPQSTPVSTNSSTGVNAGAVAGAVVGGVVGVSLLALGACVFIHRKRAGGLKELVTDHDFLPPSKGLGKGKDGGFGSSTNPDKGGKGDISMTGLRDEHSLSSITIVTFPEDQSSSSGSGSGSGAGRDQGTDVQFVPSKMGSHRSAAVSLSLQNGLAGVDHSVHSVQLSGNSADSQSQYMSPTQSINGDVESADPDSSRGPYFYSMQQPSFMPISSMRRSSTDLPMPLHNWPTSSATANFPSPTTSPPQPNPFMAAFTAASRAGGYSTSSNGAPAGAPCGALVSESLSSPLGQHPSTPTLSSSLNSAALALTPNSSGAIALPAASRQLPPSSGSAPTNTPALGVQPSLSPSSSIITPVSSSSHGGVAFGMSLNSGGSYLGSPALAQSPTNSILHGSNMPSPPSSFMGQSPMGMLSNSKSMARPVMDIDSIDEYCNMREQLWEQDRASDRDEAPSLSRPSRDLLNVYNRVASMEPGTIFYNKYKVKASPILGRFSVVVLAKNVYSKARVAIKFYTQLEQFEREKRALRQLSSLFVPALEEPIYGYEDYPPALVMERGKQTLTDWLRTQRPDAMLQKTALHQLLGALVHLHTHRLVHRDVKPSNIMWFEESHRFKLIDLAECCPAGEPTRPACTPLYSAPELMKAAVEQQPLVSVQCSADMWSFGIIAYEVLTGCRFYGPNPELRDVLEGLFGHTPLPTEGEDSQLSSIELVQARRLIVNLLQRTPAKRWSAATAYRNALFDSAEDTDQKKEAWGKIIQKITEVQQLAQASTAEMHAASLAINFTICERKIDAMLAANSMSVGGAGSSAGGASMGGAAAAAGARERGGSAAGLNGMFDLSGINGDEYEEVPMTQDDGLQDPIFMLILYRKYHIKITMVHKRGMDLLVDRIEYLKLTMPDGETQVLPVHIEPAEKDNTLEAVVHWEPAASPSRLLHQATPVEGPLSRRVITMNAELVFYLRNLEAPVKVNATLNVTLSKRNIKYTLAKWKAWSAERWSQAPQWVRDVGKGALVLTKVAGSQLGIDIPDF